MEQYICIIYKCSCYLAGVRRRIDFSPALLGCTYFPSQGETVPPLAASDATGCLPQVLYVMELVQNQEEGKAYFSSISEFLLTHPVLSFGIQMVSRCRLRHTEVLSAEEESDGLSAGK